ncbi:MAG: RDD family protein [Mycoplasmataceae bacterium]|nr:RDD family protein [Mycoplasmataceae bacterium]
MPNVLSSISSSQNPKARYALAKASNRIFARILDAAIVLILSFGVAIIIVVTDKAGIKAALNLQQTWRYLLMSLISTIIFVFYFLLLPYLTKGKTIAFFMFKLRIYNLIPTKNFFINLVKREFFLWIVVVFANLVLGITLCTMSSNDAADFLKRLMQSDDNAKTSQASVVIFQVLYAIGAILLLFVVIHMCINNKRRCFIDHISDTVVIKLVDISSNESNSSSNTKIGGRRRNYGLPGEIIGSAESEIDSL